MPNHLKMPFVIFMFLSLSLWIIFALNFTEIIDVIPFEYGISFIRISVGLSIVATILGIFLVVYNHRLNMTKKVIWIAVIILIRTFGVLLYWLLIGRNQFESEGDSR